MKNISDIIYSLCAIIFLIFIGGISIILFGFLYGLMCVIILVALFFEFLDRLFFNNKNRMVQIKITKK